MGRWGDEEEDKTREDEFEVCFGNGGDPILSISIFISFFFILLICDWVYIYIIFMPLLYSYL